MTKKLATIYTVAMAIGALVGIYFSPMASMLGAFAGLYIIAQCSGRIPKELNRHPQETGNRVIDNHNKIFNKRF